MQKAIFSLLFVLILVGCAPTSMIATGTSQQVRDEALAQQALALTTQRDRSERISSLYWPIREANTDLCEEDVAYKSGFQLVMLDDLGREYREAASEKLGISHQISVYAVSQEGPADKAGLQFGDEILAIDSLEIQPGKRGSRKLFDYLEERQGSPYSLTFRRNGEQLTTDVTPQVVCAYEIGLDPADEINAYADGTNLFITTGMYRFVENDQELQLVIAHELAHNSEGHLDKKVGNALFGAVFDIAAAAYGVNTQGAFSNATSQMFSQEFESEADYVGMYMLARAGIPTAETANFWRRMAAEYPSSIRGSFGSSHPSSAERFINIEATDAEIRSKVDANAPLLPDRKD